MELNAVIGAVVIAGGIGFMTFLVLWSRKTIQKIADKHLHSAREIMEELRNDK